MAMIIREATEDDCVALAVLNGEVQKLHADAYPDVFKWPTDPLELSTYFTEAILNPQHRIFIGELDGEPIGYIQCEEVQRGGNALCLAQAFIYVHHLVVKSTHRNQGYGKQLMRAVVEFAKASGNKALRLDYWSFNREAAEFFARQGFSAYREFAWVSIPDGSDVRS